MEIKILACKSAQQLNDIAHLKKLSGYQTYYRIKIGDYRIGFELNKFTGLSPFFQIGSSSGNKDN